VIAHSPETKSWAWTKDLGLTSKAGAGAKVEGSKWDILVGGYGFGLNGDFESSYSRVGFGADLYQANKAGEFAADGYATGFNESGFDFYVDKEVTDIGQSSTWWIFDIPGAATGLHGISGDAITKGKTEVTIKPDGSYRMASAETQNMTQINVPFDGSVNEYASVFGNGNVGAAIQNGGSLAQGTASFNYTGMFSGSGSAKTFNSVNVGPNGTSVYSHSQSRAVADVPLFDRID